VTRSHDDLVLLAVASSEIEATIWHDALAQEGIRALIRNRDPLAPIGVPLRFDLLELFVHVRDEKRARWVIGEGAEPAPAKAPDPVPEEQEPAALD
jgi:hypothetical protein